MPRIRIHHCALTGFAVLVLLAAWPASGTVYTWTDSGGVTHYSDQATDPGARSSRLTVRPLDRLSETRDLPRSSDADDTNGASSNERSTIRTHAPRILTPAPNTVIDNTQDQVVVTVELRDDDSLGPDETLIYRLDGRVLGDAPARATRLAIAHLDAGPHRLEVVLALSGHDSGRQDAVSFSVAEQHADSSANSGRRNAPPS